LFSGNLPRGAGLASSAALEVAACLALTATAGLELPGEETAILCCEAENDFVGMPCGIMDQFVITHGRRGHALLLDCRDLRGEQLPLNDAEYALVITNSGKKRKLAETVYHERRAQCTEGAKLMRRYVPDLRQLRDVTPEQFARCQEQLPEIVRKRCAHVIGENDRVLQAAELLRRNQLPQVGALMTRSHCSLRDLYEVSCPELDAIVDTSLAVPGVLGARMTGAGFGGCAVTLVDRAAVEELVSTVTGAYQKRFAYPLEFYLCPAGQGAGEICDI
jgi:galactokinase